MRIYKREWAGSTGEPRAAWAVAFRNPLTGKAERRTLKGIESKADASAAAALLYADLNRRALLGADAGPSLEEKALSLRELLDYHAKRSGVSPWTVAKEKNAAARLTTFFGEGSRVLDLKATDAERYKETRLQAGLLPNSVNKEMALLKAAMRRAVELGLLPSVPFESKKLREIAPRRRFLSSAESTAILEQAKAKSPTLWETLAFLANSGLRPAELWRMVWRDADLSTGTLAVVSAKRGRAAEQRRDSLPLNNVALAALKARAARLFPGAKTPPPDALVFGTPPEKRRARRNGATGPRGTVEGVEFLGGYRLNHALKALAKAAGVDRPEGLSLYSLRHGIAMAALQAGASIRDTAEILRHRNPTLTLTTYSHADQKAIRRTLEAIAIGGPKSTEEGA